MRVLITGVTGLLGRYLVRQSPPGIDLHGASRHLHPGAIQKSLRMHTVDLVDTTSVADLLNFVEPDAIVHAAAEGRVDVVEEAPLAFWPLNVEAPTTIAKFCASRNIPLIFVSSNAVFSGDTTSPYRDDSPMNPINAYGRLKAEAEGQVKQAYPEAQIIRPILMYGWPLIGARTNPAATWVDMLRRGEQVRVVDDVITQPLSASDAANAIWMALHMGVVETMNIGGGLQMSLFQFANEVANAFNLDDSLIQRASSSDFPALAPRPLHTTFTNHHVMTSLGISPMAPREGLQQMALCEASMNVT